MFFRFFLITTLVAAAFAAGWRVEDWRYGAMAEKAVAQVVTVTRRQGEVNTAAAAKDAMTQAQVRYVTKTITKEVPRYVTPEIDRNYPLPVGLVRVYDAGVLGLADVSQLSDPAGRADDQASGVTASAAGVIFTANTGECLASQARLVQLQDWLIDQGVVVAR